MTDWYTDYSIEKDKIYILPPMKIHTISCVEEYEDKENETRGIKITTKPYVWMLKPKDKKLEI